MLYARDRGRRELRRHGLALPAPSACPPHAIEPDHTVFSKPLDVRFGFLVI